jgi:SSS family solute:Na+ symporter
MAMTTSDANAIPSVFTRDIFTTFRGKGKLLSSKGELITARTTTLVFVLLTMIVALEQNSFGGVLGLLVSWFGPLVGPISIAMLFGLLPVFRNSGPAAAIISLVAGVLTFALDKYVFTVSEAAQQGMPVLVSAFLHVVIGWFTRNRRAQVDQMMDVLRKTTRHGIRARRICSRSWMLF